MLARSHPQESAELLALAQIDVDERWRYYRQLAGIERTVAHLGTVDWTTPLRDGPPLVVPPEEGQEPS